MADEFQQQLRQLIRARFPLLYVQTAEETRALQSILAALRDPSVRRRDLYTWTVTNGLAQLGHPGAPETRDPGAALTAAAKLDLASVVVAFDLHPWLGSANQPADPRLVRQLRDLAQQYRDGSQPRTLILVAPVLAIPVELENTVTVVDFPLPDQARLRELLVGMIEANEASRSVTVDLGDDPDAVLDTLARGALGLTLAEAENAFARAMADDNRLDVDDVPVVMNGKRQIIRRSGVLEVVASTLALSDIGGLANLKAWLVKRAGAWTAEAARYGLPAPKGVLVTGVPGCGKSMTAKAMASAWSIPLIRLDIGRVFAGLVGASEQNMRKALETAEAIAPCVLWIDEIEKGFASASGERDSGTSARVFGTFLTWMQERRKPVFVIATANDISRCRPSSCARAASTRSSSSTCPTADRADRHLRGCTCAAGCAAGPDLGDLDVDDALLAGLADATEGFTGRRDRAGGGDGLLRRVRRPTAADRRGPGARDRHHGAAVGHPGRGHRGAAGGRPCGRCRPRPSPTAPATRRSRRPTRRCRTRPPPCSAAAGSSRCEGARGADRPPGHHAGPPGQRPAGGSRLGSGPMCGIIGYVGPQQALPLVMDGLRRMEYRGYDSAGVAIQDDGGSVGVARKAGVLANLERLIADDGLECPARPVSGTPAGPPTAPPPTATRTRTGTPPAGSRSSTTASSRTSPRCDPNSRMPGSK